MPAAEFKLQVQEFYNVFTTGKSCPFKIVPLAARGTKLEACNFPEKQEDERMGKPPPRQDAEGVVQTTIQIDRDAGSPFRLKFWITGRDGKYARWHPIGIAFSRADRTEPRGAPITTDAQLLPTKPLIAPRKLRGEVNKSPFTGLKLNRRSLNVLEFTVHRLKVHSAVPPRKTRTHTTYRFAVFIQNLDTGEIGVIDPEVENPY